MIDPFEIINRYLIYPLYYWKNGDKRLQRLDELESSQYYSKPQLESLQLLRLKKIVDYAYHNTNYYHKVMTDRNISPSDIKELKDIEKLPILTKQVIQNNIEDMISTQYRKDELIKDSSGGSTGEPTIYFKDRDRHNLRRADQIRHDRWSGWDIGKRKAIIWGAQRDLSATQSFRENILSTYIERQYELDAFELTDEKMHDFCDRLETLKPSMILGYANALELFAHFILANRKNHKIRLDGIISSAETLTEEKRKIIENAFGCKVLNRYGSREVGLIASECKNQTGLHINAENVYLELVNGDGIEIEDGNGDILVTDFWNFGMPLIRYKLGDVGTKTTKTCSCGRGLPLLGKVAGRSGDFFVSQSGTKIHGEYFTHLFYELPQVKQFQMIQETKEQITLYIVENKPQQNLDYLKNVIEKTKEMLGDGVQIDIVLKDQISPTSTGKLLFTISKVNQ